MQGSLIDQGTTCTSLSVLFIEIVQTDGLHLVPPMFPWFLQPRSSYMTKEGYTRPLLVQDQCSPETMASHTDLGGSHSEDEVCPM